MTTKKRLFTLVNELKAVKKLVDKEIRKADKYNREYKMWADYEWGNADNYIFITRDGMKYVFSCESCRFPDVDFNQIVYVGKSFVTTTTKKNGKLYRTSFPGTHYDSVKGFYNISDDYGYRDYCDSLYNVTEYIECL